MSYWKNFPNQETPLNDDNLSRIEMYLEATCEVDSDYIINIVGNLTNNMIIKISFPSAIDSDKQARLSIDNGTTFYDIKDQLGKDLESKKTELYFFDNKWNLKLESYSANEDIVGKWIDGKNIYRQILSGNLPSTSGWKIFYTFENDFVDTLINIKGIFIPLDSRKMPLSYPESGYQISLSYKPSTKSVEIHQQSNDFTNRPCTIIMEYTKK